MICIKDMKLNASIGIISINPDNYLETVSGRRWTLERSKMVSVG